MCVSASASFAVSAGLTAVGFAIQQYRVVAGHQQMIAVIPFIFAAQQFSEGLVWLGVNGMLTDSVQHVAMYIFAIIAFSTWPVYIPLAMLQYERNSLNRLMLPTLILGIAVGGYFLWGYTWYSQLHLERECTPQGCGPLAYRYALPYLQDSIRYYYLLAIITPFILSHNQQIKYFLAPIVLASFPLGDYLSNTHTFASVWCFIAALVSSCIFFIFNVKNKY